MRVFILWYDFILIWTATGIFLEITNFDAPAYAWFIIACVLATISLFKNIAEAKEMEKHNV